MATSVITNKVKKMDNDRRENPRTEAKGLEAKILITEANGSIFIVEVNLLNVSRSGIKVRSKKPLLVEKNTKVQLEILLPKSGLPVIVDALVVHNAFKPEFGLHYVDVRPEDPLEQLITECGDRTHWLEDPE